MSDNPTEIQEGEGNPQSQPSIYFVNLFYTSPSSTENGLPSEISGILSNLSSPQPKFITVSFQWFPQLKLRCCVEDTSITVEDWLESFMSNTHAAIEPLLKSTPEALDVNTNINVCLTIGSKQVNHFLSHIDKVSSTDAPSLRVNVGLEGKGNCRLQLSNILYDLILDPNELLTVVDLGGSVLEQGTKETTTEPPRKKQKQKSTSDKAQKKANTTKEGTQGKAVVPKPAPKKQVSSKDSTNEGETEKKGNDKNKTSKAMITKVTNDAMIKTDLHKGDEESSQSSDSSDESDSSDDSCLLYTSPSPRDRTRSRMPSSA